MLASNTRAGRRASHQHAELKRAEIGQRQRDGIAQHQKGIGRAGGGRGRSGTKVHPADPEYRSRRLGARGGAAVGRRSGDVGGGVPSACQACPSTRWSTVAWNGR
jgi:hypothetical protein